MEECNEYNEYILDELLLILDNEEESTIISEDLDKYSAYEELNFN